MAETEKNKNIVFFHPDLGIGGAERLIIDAAVGLQRRGHRVVIYTSHCDPSHCFDEARDGTLDVRVRGNSIFPATVFGGRFTILCAIARQLHLLLHLAVFTDELKSLYEEQNQKQQQQQQQQQEEDHDDEGGGGGGGGGEVAFFVDQLSAGLPVLKTLVPTA